ncbi:PaaI family thioesterase [Ktedonospora formicarum]|uniref:Medium/long-chain acyl-CoA thioesterase YigI n=1 Tax=Ktedonospora formicarum TaxID=2778364 RepID=A0A8J3MXC8_9CHLR|nr:PaaI family thioesterase [Ktedonospora formicarum]GHO51295.1 thioesterase superfamily protein [Ktedonospora formicarum]
MIPPDPDYVVRVQTSFGRQQAMALLGAQMTEVRPGVTEIVLPFREELTQQHGFVHAGIITAIADSACGYAALSLMPPGVGVLTIEFKVNLLNPAAGERFIARGQVVKPGRTIMVCTGEVVAQRADSTQQTVALMQATMMVVRDRPTVSD